MKLLFIGLILLLVNSQLLFAKTKVSILIKMIPEQEKWFKKNIIKPFEKKEGVKVIFKYFKDYKEEEDLLSLDKSYDVIKVPMDRAICFRSKSFISPIGKLLNTEEKVKIKKDFIFSPLTISRGVIQYIPRKLETRIMVYRLSKVSEAFENHNKYLDTINTALKVYNGIGLPQGYEFEEDPNMWDYFDVLVAGFVWHEMSNSGKIGHRAKNYAGTVLRIIDRAYQLGAFRNDILHLSSTHVFEAFEWEYIYSKLGVYNSKMFEEKWSGQNLWQAFGNEDIYLSFLTQLDCFFLLGTGKKGLKGYMPSIDDIGFALMPKAEKLDADIGILTGQNITTGGWVWGIGHDSKQKELALKLILHMTTKENQKAEFNAFGVMPARKELLRENRDRLYLKKWRNQMLQTSAKQLKMNRHTILPHIDEMDNLQKKYYNTLLSIYENKESINSPEDLKKIILKND